MPKKKPARRTPAKKPRKQPESLRFASVAPSFTVNDLSRSLTWYRDVIGFQMGDKWERDGKLEGAELKAGTVVFILNQDDFSKGRDRVKGEGFRLYCRTRQDINALAAAIKARGGALASEPTDRPWGTRDFSLTDPDGYRFSITTMGS